LTVKDGLVNENLIMKATTLSFNWNNPECETTYGTTFTEHGSPHEVTNMMIKSQEQGRQLDDKKLLNLSQK